jgi:alpha-mannosidase
MPVVVFNPLAWSRTDVVEAEVQFQVAARDVEVRDPAGRAVLSEVLAKDATTHRWRVRFVAQDVPSLGYKVFSIVPAAQPRRPATSVAATGTTMENEFFRVVVDAKTGCISSLYEKRAKRQALAPGACGNLLQAFTDKPKDWDAWNIDANFEDEKWDLDKADEVRLLEAGALRAAIRVVKRFRKSAFTQDITLSAGVPRVDIRTQADWQETHVLIKAAFPVAAKSDVATFEIPYGSIERPTTRNTPEEKAKFEVPALRWADLSDAGGGLSLLNDSKYGYDAKGNVLRLSLLRSPVWPDPQADRGRHEFTYSLYPHAGGWREAGTLRRAWELNYPLLPVVTQAHAGTLPPTHSFVELDAENVVLTAVKKAEDDDALILRVYEFAGRGTQARVGLSASLRAPQRAWLANLMEQPAEELKVAGGTVVVPLKPYEIQTVKVQFAARSIP